MGRSSGDGCTNAPAPSDCASSPQSTGGPRAGDPRGGSSGSPRCVKIWFHAVEAILAFFGLRTSGSKEAGSCRPSTTRRISPPHLGHASGNSSPSRASSFAQAIRDVSWWQGFVSMVPVEPQPPLPAAAETPACSPVFAFRCFLRFPMASAVTACRSGWFGATTPSVTQACRCTCWLSAEPKRCWNETAPSRGRACPAASLSVGTSAA